MKSKHDLAEEDWIILGKESAGFSGQDCLQVAKLAVNQPFLKCQAAKRFKKTKDGGWTPTLASDLEGTEMTVLDVDPKLLRIPAIDLDDLRQILQDQTSSVTAEQIEKHLKWTEDYG